MKKIINLLLAFSLVFAFSCKSREKQVQKSETQTETKSEATYHIEEKTFEIVLDKSKIFKDFFYKNSSSETSKQEKKNIDKGKEYYENGNLKKEWERDLSELSESAKSVLEELNTKLIKETETSQYWEESSDFYQKSLEQEKTKTKDYAMKLKAKETFTWQMFFVGILVGWIALPNILKWFKSWLLRFNPYLKLVEKVKKVYGKL